MGNNSSNDNKYKLEELTKHVAYLTKHTQTLKSQKEILEIRNNQSLIKINDLNNDIVKLNTKKKIIENKNQELQSSINKLSIKNIDIDNKKIKEGVKQILDNKETNSILIPDSIEAELYENCIKLFLKTL